MLASKLLHSFQSLGVLATFVLTFTFRFVTFLNDTYHFFTQKKKKNLSYFWLGIMMKNRNYNFEGIKIASNKFGFNFGRKLISMIECTSMWPRFLASTVPNITIHNKITIHEKFQYIILVEGSGMVEKYVWVDFISHPTSHQLWAGEGCQPWNHS